MRAARTPPSGEASVINKPTIISNVETDGTGIGQIRNDLSQDIWEAGITLQLNNLTTIRPFQSSKPVVDALSRRRNQWAARNG
jgi:hypothetical protein